MKTYTSQPGKTSGAQPIYAMTLTGVMTALLCVISPLAVPVGISPVPITLATLVLMLVSCLAGWRLGALSCSLYLILGMAGLPVFSGFGSGIGKVVGPTGGYLVGYIPLCILSGLIFEYSKNRLLQVFLLVLPLLWSSICPVHCGFPGRQASLSPRAL